MPNDEIFTPPEDRGGIADFSRGTDPDLVGLKDAAAGGWFRNDTGELIEGFQIRPEDVVVDVGSGDGGNIYFCGQQGAHVAFVDVDPVRVAETERRARTSRAREVTPILSDSDPVPLPDGFASVVICTEVLEHVPDPNRLMAELVRLGRPGARYLISVPDPLCEGAQHKLAPDSFFRPPNHIRTFGREQFQQLVLGHGLMIEKIHYYGFYWAVRWALFWSCEKQVGPGVRHPALDDWAHAWIGMLQSPDGALIKRTLDDIMPKSQLILARKP